MTSVPSDGDPVVNEAAPIAAPPAPVAPADRADAWDIGASGLRAFAGLVAGFALLALVNAGAIMIGVPMPRAGAWLRVQHHLWDAAESLAVGAISGAILGGFSARVRLPIPAAFLAYGALAAPVIHLALEDDLRRQGSVTLEGKLETAIYYVLFALVSLALPAAHAIGGFLSRYPRLRFVPLTVALGGMIGDHVHLRDDYFGVHGGIAWIAATLAGASIAPLAERALLSLASRRGGRVALAAALAFGLFGLVPPPNAVRFELFRQPCSIASWALAAVAWPSPHARAKAPDSPWIQRGAAEVPPTASRPLPSNPVVVFITVDATRADAIADPAHDALFPTFAEMKRRGVFFTRAVAPGSQTAVSLSATFSGRYLSELDWTRHGTGSARFIYPADDPSPRFPALLTQGGVTTAAFHGVNFLAGDFGVARGFAEERVIPKDRRHAQGREVIDPLLRRLERVGNERFFIYTHLMEPHAPYDRGRKEGSQRERYLSEIAVADALVGRVVAALEKRFAGRWLLVVSADHGEAFGEHQTHQHTKTLYDELTRVPLLMLGPALAPRVVHERAGLIDLGPTFLDLFGLPTPASYSGKSLVPAILGRELVKGRPMFAEGRLRRAMWSPDGLKVILDLRRKVVEVYDLERDPGETRNLYDSAPDRERADAALAMLEAYFAVHTVHGGYHPPFKP